MIPITLEEMKAVKLMNRTDTKFVTSRKVLEQLLESVDEDYYIQTAGNESRAAYHTLYFDTADCRMYLAHHNGRKHRQKLRIRSYVKSDLHFLEVKTKDNRGKTHKKRVQLSASLPVLNARTLLEADPLDTNIDFLATNLWIPAQSLEAKIENRFTRITLVNKAKTERLTIDTDLRFGNLVTGNQADLSDLAIIELKRDSLQPSPILPHLNRLRIFSMGFSKYCMGMAMTDPALKQNRFKQRLHLIQKF